MRFVTFELLFTLVFTGSHTIRKSEFAFLLGQILHACSDEIRRVTIYKHDKAPPDQTRQLNV